MNSGKRNLTLYFLVAWCAILIGACIALYFYNPEVKQAVDFKIAAWRIEHKLQDKYEVEFEVLENWIEEGNGLPLDTIMYPEMEAKYTFIANFEVDGDKHQIAGFVDEDMEIIADSYAHYIYKDEVLQALTDAVSEVVPMEKIFAVCCMDPRRVITLSEDAESLEAFMKGTKTYESLYLLVDENCFEEKLASIRLTLTQKEFPFSVLLAPVTAEDIGILRENNIKCFVENYEMCWELFDYFSVWWEITEDRGEYYLWYQNEENQSNAAKYDAIIKDVE